NFLGNDDSRAPEDMAEDLEASRRGGVGKDACPGFEPQPVRRSLCRSCHRTKSQHGATGTTSAAAAAVAASGGSTSSPRSSRTSSSSGMSRRAAAASAATPESKRKEREEEGGARGFGRDSISRSRSASKESLRSCGSGRSAGGGRSAAGNLDDKYVEELESDLFELEDKYAVLCRDKQLLDAQLEERLGDIEDLERELDSCKTRGSTLEKRIPQLEQEVRCYRERLRLPESEQRPAAADFDDFEGRARELEDLCRELTEENDQLKEEVEELQRELEEMHDSFQDKEEGRTGTVRELQRELDAANKSYRVVQFKLRKAERRFEQCEAERAELEEKFRRLGERILSGDDSLQIQELEDELRTAKEVSVRLHDELEYIEQKRNRLEADNQRLKIQLESSEREKIRLENDMDRVRLELDKVKTDAGISDAGPLQVVDKSSPRPRLGQAASRESSVEEDHLKRELSVAREREADLVEQLRFSKEEVKIMRRKLQEAEEENEALTAKINRLADGAGGGGGGVGGGGGGGGDDDSAVDLDDSEEPSTETVTLRRQVLELDMVNQRLRGSVAALESRLESRGLAPHLSPSDKQLLFKYSTQEAESLLGQLDSEMEEMKRKITTAAQLSPEDLALHEKWLEANEARRRLDAKVDELRVRVSQLESTNADLRLEAERLEAGQRQTQQQQQPTASGTSSERRKTSIDQLGAATKADLIREVGDLEDEIEDLQLAIRKGTIQSESLEYRLKTMEEDLSESRRNFEEDEHFFVEQLEKLQKQNELLGDLLALVTMRKRFLYEYESSADSADSSGPGAGASADNDEVFTDGQPPEQDVKYWDKKFLERLHSLEILLREERQRTKHYQKRLDSMREDQRREVMDSEKYKIMIEDKETQLKDYQNRLEQGKKKYDSLKQLAETQQQRGNEESVRAQLAELKTQNDQLAAKLARMEKEKAAADRSLQVLNEGLKLREEHISEQDESMQTLQRKLVDADREFERLKGELHLLKTQFTSVREKSNEGARLREELRRRAAEAAERDRQLDELRQQLAAVSADLEATRERQRLEQEAAAGRDDRIREKDELISLISGRLAGRERELGRLDGDLGEANRRLSEAEAEAQAARQQAADWEASTGGPARRRLAELTAERAAAAEEAEKLRSAAAAAAGKPAEAAAGVEDEARRLRAERDRDRAETALLRRDLESIRAPGGAARETGQGEIASHWSSTGDLPTATRVRLRHLQLVERIYLQQTHEQVTLQLQLEAYQREVDEFRRLYTEAADRCRRERDAWEKQREALEAQLRAQSSSASQSELEPFSHLSADLTQRDQQLRQLEAQLAEQRQKHSELVSRLSKENRQLLSRVSSSGSGVPRMFQRFTGAAKSGASAAVGGAGDSTGGPFDAERAELQVRLAEQERRVERQRKEAAELAGKMAEMRLEQLERWGGETGRLWRRIEEMRLTCDQAGRLQRESTEWRVRAESLQETLAKESQRWVGERCRCSSPVSSCAWWWTSGWTGSRARLRRSVLSSWNLRRTGPPDKTS
ncbi:hypothetical protein BOX15_Mlig017524g1, partial [Macrostomum lignano]